MRGLLWIHSDGIEAVPYADLAKKRVRDREYYAENRERVRTLVKKRAQDNPEKISESRKLRYRRDVEGNREKTRQYQAEKPEKKLEANFKRRYGITLAEYRRLFDDQGGVCKICGKPESTQQRGKTFRLAVDHCHSSGTVRGLLCANCNNMLGRAKDDPKVLEKAAQYLRESPKGPSSASL